MIILLDKMDKNWFGKIGLVFSDFWLDMSEKYENVL